MENQTELFGSLTGRIAGIVGGQGAPEAKLESVCKILKDEVAHYDWVGFYLVDPEKPDELVLGPFAGEPTEHTRIPFGKGICGQAAARGEVFVVQDVTKESNYLSCSPVVRSEIVLPIFREGELIGELDIDSHTPGPFTDEDAPFLENICGMVAKIL